MRASRVLPVLLPALLCSLAAGAGAASSLRCEDTVIRVGDHASKLLRACGDPGSRELVSGDDARRVELWVYAPASTDSPRRLTVASGRIVRIERMDD